MNDNKTFPYLHGRSPMQYLIEQRIGYDEALDIENGLGKQAAAEWEALKEELDGFRATAPKNKKEWDTLLAEKESLQRELDALKQMEREEKE